MTLPMLALRPCGQSAVGLTIPQDSTLNSAYPLCDSVHLLSCSIHSRLDEVFQSTTLLMLLMKLGLHAMQLAVGWAALFALLVPNAAVDGKVRIPDCCCWLAEGNRG